MNMGLKFEAFSGQVCSACRFAAARQNYSCVTLAVVNYEEGPIKFFKQLNMAYNCSGTFRCISSNFL